MDLPPTQPWIKAATAPLTDNPELQLAAQHELAQLAGPAEAEKLAILEKRFHELNELPPITRKRRTFLRRGLIALPLLILPLLYLTDGRRLRAFSQQISMMGPMGGALPTPKLLTDLSPDESLLLNGDPTAPTPELQWKALWDSDPSNPAYFSEYINACEPLPTDFLEVAREIDPDNGWFLLVKAGELAKQAVKKGKPINPKPSLRLPPEERYKVADDLRQVSEWIIRDQALLDEALALIHEASSKPRFECYDEAILRQRLALLPPEKDFESRILRTINAASTNTPQIFAILHTTKGICAASTEMAKHKDQDSLRALIQDSDRVTQGVAASGDLLLRQLVNVAVASQTNEHLLYAAEQAGLTAQAENLWPTVLAFREINYLRKTQDREADDTQFRMHAGILLTMSVPTLTRVDPNISFPTTEELKPERLAEYAVAERVSLIALTTILSLSAGIGCILLPVFRGRLTRLLGLRFAQMLTLRDYCWIILLGTISPVLWYALVCKLTPLGGREIGLAYLMFQPIGIQVAITLLLIITTTAQATRWRFHRYFAPLQTGPRHPKKAWLFPVLLALALPLTGFTALLLINRTVPPPISTSVGFGLPALLLCYFLWIGTRAFLGKHHHAPYRIAVARVLAPAFAISALALLVLYPATTLAERYWIARDTVGHSGTENLGFPPLEMEAAHAIQERLLEALNAKVQ